MKNRRAGLARKVQVKRRRTTPRRSSRVLNSAYLDFIASLPCRICYAELYLWMEGTLSLAEVREMGQQVYGRQKSRTEVAHVGERGASQKCPDSETVPLCHEHHRTGKDAHHGPLGKGFWEHHGLERDQVIRQLNEAYERGAECS